MVQPTTHVLYNVHATCEKPSSTQFDDEEVYYVRDNVPPGIPHKSQEGARNHVNGNDTSEMGRRFNWHDPPIHAPFSNTSVETREIGRESIESTKTI